MKLIARRQTQVKGVNMRIGIATDNGGFGLKEGLLGNAGEHARIERSN